MGCLADKPGKWQKTFVSLGSNSQDAIQMLDRAVCGIDALDCVFRYAASSVYCTEPQDYKEQPWFYNQVLELHVGHSWTASSFLDALLALETSLGRKRVGERYGPRCIDLDLLLFGDETRHDVRCTVPHIRMHRRAFVLVPLAEIAPNVLIRGLSPHEWLSRLVWHVDDNKIFQSG